MFRGKTLGSLVVALASAVALSTPTMAQQDCGTDCRACATEGHEGYNYSPTGDNHMNCLVTETGCFECGERVNNSAAISARSIAQLLDAVEEHEMAAVVTAYGDRILVDDVRGVVAVQGNACNPHAVDTIVFLTKSKARSLQDAGARSLRAVLLSSPVRRVSP